MKRQTMTWAAVGLAALVAWAAPTATAAPLTWDGNGAAEPNPNGGAGTWDVNTTANWWNGTTNVVWPAPGGTDDDAVFAYAAGTVSLAAGGVSVNDIAFNTAGYVIQNNTLTLNGTTPTVTADANAAISAVIAGAGVSLTKAGTGTLTLSGANTYSGGTVINAGAISVGNASAFGTGALTLAASGTVIAGSAFNLASADGNAGRTDLNVSGNAAFSNNVTLTGGTSYLLGLSIGGAGTLTYGGVVTAYNGRMDLKGTVTLILATGASISLTGSNGNQVLFSGPGATLILAGGSFACTGNNGTTASYLGNLTMNSGTASMGGALSTQIALNANATVNLNGGTLSVQGISGAASNTLNFNGGTLKALASNANFLSPLIAANVQAGGAVVDTGAFNPAIAGVLAHDAALGATADGGLTKLGSGTLTLSGTSTYTGATTVNAGKLVVNGSLAGGVTVAGGVLAGSGSAGATAVAAGGTVEGGNSGSGTLTLASLTYAGAGKVQGYLGAATPIAVTGQVTPNGGPGSVTVVPLNLPADGTYHFLSYGAGTDPFGALQFAVPTRGMTLVDNAASNVIDIAIHTGAYPIWTGALSGEWSTNALASPKNWVLNTGGEADFMALDAVRFDDAHGLVTNVQVAAVVRPDSVTVRTTNAYIFAGQPIVSAGALVKEGSGTLRLAASNTFARVDVRGGTLALGAGGATGWVRAGGALSLSNGTTLVVDRSNAATTDFTTTGPGGFKKAGAGTLNVVTQLRHGGDTVISSGTLRLDSGAFSGGLGAGTGRIVLGDADTGVHEARLAVWGYYPWPPPPNYFVQPILVAAGPVDRLVIARNGGTFAGIVSGTVTLNNNVVLRNDGGDRLSVDGLITGTGNIFIEGNRVNFGGATNDFVGDVTIMPGGVLQLNGNRSVPLTAAVTVNGTLQINANQATAPSFNGLNGAGVVNSPYGGGQAVLTVGAGNGNGAFAGGVQGNLALTKAGTGTQTLSGANSHTGPTTVSAGTLRLGAPGTLGSAHAIRLAGGTLDMGDSANGVGTLDVTAASALRLGAGALAFADSSALAWAGSLNLEGRLGPTTLRVGTNAAGLTPAQLARIRCGGCDVSLTAEGYLQAASGMLLIVR